jgi:hypothetical protein
MQMPGVQTPRIIRYNPLVLGFDHGSICLGENVRGQDEARDGKLPRIQGEGRSAIIWCLAGGLSSGVSCCICALYQKWTCCLFLFSESGVIPDLGRFARTLTFLLSQVFRSIVLINDNTKYCPETG